MSERVVVVLVPGIFASHLINVHGGLAWPVNRTQDMARHLVGSPSTQRRAFLDSTHFQARGPVPAPDRIDSDPGGEAGWQDVALDFYRPFLRACQAAGSPGPGGAAPLLSFQPLVFAIGYNFALSNAVSSSDIINQTEAFLIANRTPSQPPLRIIFVTHSMGALVVRDALRKDAELRQRCISVIHVAAPNAGAPEALMRYVRGSTDEDWRVRYSFGDRGWKCLTSASTVRAGFQLLPYPMLEAQHRAKFAGGSRVVDTASATVPPSIDPFFIPEILDTQFAEAADFTVTVSKDGAITKTREFHVPENDARGRYSSAKNQLEDIRRDVITQIREARKFHSTLGDYVFPRTGAVVLTGVPTVERVVFQFQNNLLKTATEFLGDGDGTVPVASQKHLIRGVFALGQEGVRNKPFVEMQGVEHANALGAAGASKFPEIFRMMDLFYRAAPPSAAQPQPLVAGAAT